MKIKEVKKIVLSRDVHVFGLVKARVQSKNVDRVKAKWGIGWKWITNSKWSEKGRIWAGFDARVIGVQVVEMNDQVITCDIIENRRDSMITVSFVYGLHTVMDRISLWRYLFELKSKVNGPWLVWVILTPCIKMSIDIRALRFCEMM